jgi:hypothetical protein
LGGGLKALANDDSVEAEAAGGAQQPDGAELVRVGIHPVALDAQLVG